MTVIEIPDEQVAALKAKATAAGLTLETWLKQLAEAEREPPTAEHPLQTAADIILDCMRDVPAEVMAAQPKDGASQHDHYIYGWPTLTITAERSASAIVTTELTEAFRNDRHFEQEGFRALFRRED